MLVIGPYQLQGNLMLAPMAGVTDVTFRTLCIEQGAACAASEMISADTSLHASDKTQRRIKRVSAAVPHIVQIAGSDPQQLADAARHNVDMGADIIDINMGCPAKKVCKKLAGSALLSDENLVSRILTAVVASVDVPVTLKIRTGPSPQQRNGVCIARIAEAAGIQALAVHGRTRADKFNGDAEYDTIRDIKQAVAIPVIANGDIVDEASALSVLSHTGADGLMIGRAAQGDPFIFRRIAAALAACTQIGQITSSNNGEENKVQVPAVDAQAQLSEGADDLKPADLRASDEEMHQVITRHLQGIYQLYGEYRGVRVARKHISWYLKNKPGSAAYRQQANLLESANEQLALVDKFFQIAS